MCLISVITASLFSSSHRAILSQVEDLKVYCRNGIKRLNSRNDAVIIENGCPEILHFASAEAHVCEYGEIECPNSELCGKFKKVELADHLSDTCPYQPCPNRGKTADLCVAFAWYLECCALYLRGSWIKFWFN